MTARASTTIAAPEVAPQPAEQLRRAEPCTLIIFGAGDLLHRKLMPSLFHLLGDGLLPDDFAVITVARGEGDDESFRTEVHNSLRTFAPDGAGIDQAAWRERNRASSDSVMTGAGTSRSMASFTVQRPSPESSTYPLSADRSTSFANARSASSLSHERTTLPRFHTAEICFRSSLKSLDACRIS